MAAFAKYAVIFSVIGIFLRFAIHGFIVLESPETAVQLTAFLHLLLVLLCAFLSIQHVKKKLGRHSFIQWFKQGFKSTSLYAMCIAIFAWVYYKWIDSSYFQWRIDRFLQRVAEENPTNLENATEFFNQFFTPFNYATISLVGLMAMGGIYSVLLAALMRKVQ